MYTQIHTQTCRPVYIVYKEYVASLIGLYKNNGAVWCVGINFVIF